MAWALMKAGDELPRIAKKLSLPIEAVESSIREFESRRVLVSSDIVDMLVNHEVITAVDGVGTDIQQARKATKFTGAYDPLSGKPIMERDWATMLDSVDKVSNLLGQVRPRGGGVNVAVGIQNNGNGQGTANVKTFEQRVREKRGVLGDGNVKFLSDGKGNEIDEIVDGELMDEGEGEDEGDGDGMGIGMEVEEGDMDADADGTSDAEIEEADETRD